MLQNVSPFWILFIYLFILQYTESGDLNQQMMELSKVKGQILHIGLFVNVRIQYRTQSEANSLFYLLSLYRQFGPKYEQAQSVSKTWKRNK